MVTLIALALMAPPQAPSPAQAPPVRAEVSPYEALVAAVAADGSPRVVVVGFPLGTGRPVLPAAWVGATAEVPPGTWVAFRDDAGRVRLRRLADRVIDRVSGFRPATLCYAVRDALGRDVWVCPLGRLAKEQ